MLSRWAGCLGEQDKSKSEVHQDGHEDNKDAEVMMISIWETGTEEEPTSWMFKFVSVFSCIYAYIYWL